MRWSGPEQQRKPFQKSAGPVKPARHVPPYLPISFSGLITSGSWPMRSATGGSLPAFTSSASCGASLNVLGNWAGSVTTSGPSSLPTSGLLLCATAPAAMAIVSAPRTSAAVVRKRRMLMTPPLSVPAALGDPGFGGPDYVGTVATKQDPPCARACDGPRPAHRAWDPG